MVGDLLQRMQAFVFLGSRLVFFFFLSLGKASQSCFHHIAIRVPDRFKH